ncbi:riboflavin biosynthesis protein [Bacteroidia bacterium]|nr:riboflavin biosynthesis protein [Bacteroidia bacterium]GHT28210.1 riboflavin biosynthesis protein [Bacteroidia bacterium]GHV70828.1 riboflavin biosynthesis protein [Bacteroidia bacterium]
MEIININDTFRLKDEIAATIGFFDGVHAGHRFLINQLKTLAVDLPTAVITFPQHPRITLQSDYIPKLLTTLDEKLVQLATTGIDYCLLLDFTKPVSQLSAKAFIQEKLRKQMQVKQLLIGYDHRFGKNRAEGFNDYVEQGKACGTTVIQALELPDSDHVSSTTIRNKLSERKLKEANQMLSYHYTLQGKVIPGNQLGHQIGFPTANLQTDDNKVIPGEGIYAVWVDVETEKYPGMVYIGKRPTVITGGEKRIEVHLLDFSGDLYGKTLRLEFVEFLRDDQRFDSMEALRKQLQLDKENIQRFQRLR